MLLCEVDDRLGLMSDEHMVVMRHTSLIERANHRFQHPHARFAMKVTDIIAAEELRNVLRQWTLHIEQVDLHRLRTVGSDCLPCCPIGIGRIANRYEHALHEWLPVEESAGPFA